jgi:hypothetical protein
MRPAYLAICLSTGDRPPKLSGRDIDIMLCEVQFPPHPPDGWGAGKQDCPHRPRAITGLGIVVDRHRPSRDRRDSRMADRVRQVGGGPRYTSGGLGRQSSTSLTGRPPAPAATPTDSAPATSATTPSPRRTRDTPEPPRNPGQFSPGPAGSL